MILHISIGIIMAGVCWKWGDWKNWRTYYPTILYFIIGNLTAYILLHNIPLWQYQGWLHDNHFYPDLYYAVFVYPSMIILFLTHYPDRPMKQIAYLLLCISLFSIFEFALSALGLFSYDDNWNIWYSTGFNVIMLPLLRLHYKKPLLVWPISMALAITMLLLFGIPLGSIQ